MAIKTFTTGEVLTAADTNTYLNNGGLVYVTETAITNSATISINNCFTSTYSNYRIVISGAKHATTGTGISIKLRASGTDTSTGYYYGQLFATYAGVSGVGGGANQAAYDTQIIVEFQSTFGAIDIMGPQAAIQTGFMNFGCDTRTGGAARFTTGYLNNTTQYDGFTVLPNTGSFAAAGKIYVYGYRQA
jgi:hypothetical protein